MSADEIFRIACTAIGIGLWSVALGLLEKRAARNAARNRRKREQRAQAIYDLGRKVGAWCARLGRKRPAGGLLVLPAAHLITQKPDTREAAHRARKLGQ